MLCGLLWIVYVVLLVYLLVFDLCYGFSFELCLCGCLEFVGCLFDLTVWFSWLWFVWLGAWDLLTRIMLFGLWCCWLLFGLFTWGFGVWCWLFGWKCCLFECFWGCLLDLGCFCIWFRVWCCEGFALDWNLLFTGCLVVVWFVWIV